MKADVWQNFGFRRYEDKDELDRTKAVCKQTEVKYVSKYVSDRGKI